MNYRQLFYHSYVLSKHVTYINSGLSFLYNSNSISTNSLILGFCTGGCHIWQRTSLEDVNVWVCTRVSVRIFHLWLLVSKHLRVGFFSHRTRMQAVCKLRVLHILHKVRPGEKLSFPPSFCFSSRWYHCWGSVMQCLIVLYSPLLQTPS